MEWDKWSCTTPRKGRRCYDDKYLIERYPDAHGFFPRNVRRMRDFYCTFENHPALLPLALPIGGMRNVVIMEAKLTVEQRKWYLKAIRKFQWSKQKLMQQISKNAYKNLYSQLQKICYTLERMKCCTEYGTLLDPQRPEKLSANSENKDPNNLSSNV